MHSKLRKLAVPGVLAAGLGAGLTLADVMKDPIADAGAQQAQPAVYTGAATAPGSPAALSTAFRAASHAAMNAVVQVRTETAARTVAQQVPPELRGTPFEGMFGGQMRVAPQATSGSGFIISPEGYIVTNNHVVDGVTRVKVVLNDKRELDARVVGRDPNTDIAVLKVNGSGLPTVRLGDSDQLDTGDWVLALGYPLELGQTTTAGIVSAKGRSIGIMQRSDAASSPLEHYIQTDAAINPGNSGGPLVDLQGRVIGVNSAIASPTGYYSGYGFAVPINLARRVADDLIRYGVVHRPMMGVEIRDVTNADAEVFGLPSPDGAVVASETKGAAREAGLQMGDVIVALDGQPVRSRGDLMEAVMRKEPGDPIRVDYVRYGSRRSATLRLTQMDVRPAAIQSDAGEVADGDDAADRVGFAVTQITPQIAQQLGAPGAQGVVVSGVDPMGPAAGQLGRGVIIERFNGRAIGTVAELRQAVAALKPGQVVSITARFNDGSHTIVNFRARS
ncbi:trypsin-like peptidase domain-containing protein [Longimicrobium sp.]|uniref:trypsin-like peptidase domain-containing protein n=1 Tax=Longimicrobium sp. TaxID=2029185 RepID=UPI002C815280|nr:trypsin-like peptidase domain-containing protein [Longimicrobium sp.]HSU12819.1 trypsin-like peptidase domain-containing protein [Longimicrobium sp.]